MNNTTLTVPNSEARVVVGAGVEAGQVGVGGHGGQGVVARLLGLVRLVAPRVELLVLLRRVTARHLSGGHMDYLYVDQELLNIKIYTFLMLPCQTSYLHF